MGIILLIVIIAIIFYLINIYNNLIKMNEKINVNWSQVDVVLKQRADLIPNLVETIKAAGNYEKSTLEAVIAARNKFVSSPTKADEIQASGEITSTLNRLFALTESYPDLKANQNYMNLQEQLTKLEDKITKYRQFFNDSVYSYNRYCQVFPNSIIANMFKFNKADYFEISEEEKETPKVKF